MSWKNGFLIIISVEIIQDYSCPVLGFEGFLKMTLRQQMKTPVNARIPGARPATTQINSVIQLKRPKCKSVIQPSTRFVNRSAGSRVLKKLNASGKPK